MTTDAELSRIVRSWLEDGRTRLPDHVLDAVLADVPTTSQHRPWWPIRRFDMTPIARFVAVAAAVAVVAVIGVIVLQPPAPDGSAASPVVTSPSASPASPSSAAPSPSPSPSTAASVPSLPRLGLPGARASAAGAYGWEGGPGASAGMHKVGENGEVAVLTFAVDCLAGELPGATPVRVAGLDGVSVEPYRPPVGFGNPVDDAVTRAYALAVGARTLCVFLTWHASTTDAELAAAEAILDTIRAEQTPGGSVRVNFTLDEGWDIG